MLMKYPLWFIYEFFSSKMRAIYFYYNILFSANGIELLGNLPEPILCGTAFHPILRPPNLQNNNLIVWQRTASMVTALYSSAPFWYLVWEQATVIIHGMKIANSSVMLGCVLECARHMNPGEFQVSCIHIVIWLIRSYIIVFSIINRLTGWYHWLPNIWELVFCRSSF